MLDFAGKLLEKVIDTHLKVLCEENNMLTPDTQSVRV